MQDAEKKNGNRNKILILLLLMITVIAVGVTVWALFFRDTAPDPELAPDYAPRQEEENAEPIGDEGDEKLEAEEGGGAVSLSYSDEVTVSLSDGTVALFFANPTRSTQDIVLQIVIQDEVIVQSGLLKPGNQVKKLTLMDDAAEKLSEGGYDGKFAVLYYDPDTGEKAVVNTEIPVTVTVNK